MLPFVLTLYSLMTVFYILLMTTQRDVLMRTFTKCPNTTNLNTPVKRQKQQLMKLPVSIKANRLELIEVGSIQHI